jgi:hypothetical protein
MLSYVKQSMISVEIKVIYSTNPNNRSGAKNQFAQLLSDKRTTQKSFIMLCGSIYITY